MQRNTDGYFEYKKQKMQMSGSLKTDKYSSKFGFIFQLFVATFIVIFIVLVMTIMKFSSKVDIEYAHGEQYHSNETANAMNDIVDDVQRKIDKRLVLIQQEENAPSEAKILNSEKTKNQVIDQSFIEEAKKIEKSHKFQEKNDKITQQTIKEQPTTKITEADTTPKNTLVKLKDEIMGEQTKPKEKEKNLTQQENIIIMSKVVVGRYPTFDEAKKAQNYIKEKAPELSPYIRKIGGVYSFQMGSYQDFSVAKKVAQNLKQKGLDVWIYQQ